MKAAALANKCGVDKSTITRILKGKQHPDPDTIMAINRTFRLNEKESMELFYAAYPEWNIWLHAMKNNLTLDELDDMLYKAGLPTLSKEDACPDSKDNL